MSARLRIGVLRSVLLITLAILLAGCFGRVTIIVTATPSLAPSRSPIPKAAAATLPPTPTSISGGKGIGLWLAPEVPPQYQEALDPLVVDGTYTWAKSDSAQLKLTSGAATGDHQAEWVYAAVVPFPTVADDIQWNAIQRYWQGQADALQSLSSNNQPPTFVTTPAIKAWLTQLLGEPAAGLKMEIVPQDAIVTTLWLHRQSSFAIVPFHQLDPAMKVLTVDGASVFDRNLDLTKYPLAQGFSFVGEPELVSNVSTAVQSDSKWMATNRDLAHMTTLVMTGVTALARATAYQMEQTGITTPARDILPFMQDADFVHTSNEVAFAKDCPDPNPNYTSVNIRFCSKEKYFDLLKAIHLNIVELTGNHVNDWGTDALANSIDLYDANGVGHYGGGRNTEDSKKALIVTKNGNTIAFIGCDPAGPAPAWAKADKPGSARCDDDYLSKEIPRLKTVANIVIMSLQYEEYYEYAVSPDQVAFFKKYAAMGADLVMGSQAHVPQGFAFTDKAFIHYGIGNLFFDQQDTLLVRQMFADKLIMYNGKHISTVLFTGLLEDYSRPRPMTAAERAEFLQAIFKSSGW